MTGVRLDQLLGGIATLEPGDITVSGLTQDSHAVQAGDAFVALEGASRHGIEFAADAAAHGAVVVLAEKPGSGTRDSGLGTAEADSLPALGSCAAPEEATSGSITRDVAFSSPESRVPSPEIIWIENLRSHLGQIAARFFGDPSARMEVIGVTGTNGKTSTVHLLAQAFAHLGKQAATIGTLGTGLHGAVHAGERTTPDVIRVHGLLAEFRDAGVTHVAMEVSSHALDQHRVDGVHFDVAVFTNLTRDHLDYHGTMEAYGAAKAKLFAWPALRAAVINVDDAFGRDLATQFEQRDRHPDQGIVIPTMETSSRPGNGRDPAPGTANESSANDGKSTQTSGREKLIRYAIDAADAEVRARDVHTHPDGLAFELATPWGAGHVHSRLLGRFNVANLLAVAGVLGALDVPFTQIHEALESLQPVAGRMHRLGGADAPLVVVDYSHTPDALEQVLATLREHCAGRLICVFGCGGERDVGKRPQMGAIAEKLADVAIVTDDNPRGEDGDAIVAQIVAGMRAPQHATVERDRARAIGLAIAQAHAGDVVLIAGKGHEAYQESAGVRRPFDDTRVAQAAMGVRPC